MTQIDVNIHLSTKLILAHTTEVKTFDNYICAYTSPGNIISFSTSGMTCADPSTSSKQHFIIATDILHIPKLSGFIGMIELVLTNTGISDSVNFLLISTFPFTHSPVDQQIKVPCK